MHCILLSIVYQVEEASHVDSNAKKLKGSEANPT